MSKRRVSHAMVHHRRGYNTNHTQRQTHAEIPCSTMLAVQPSKAAFWRQNKRAIRPAAPLPESSTLYVLLLLRKCRKARNENQ
jgi:hypothetical protein